jgi:hypothetical protein
MTKDEKIKQLTEELDYVKKNSVMICGYGSEDDDGSQAKEFGIKKNETFFDFDEEGFIEDALQKVSVELGYDRVFKNGEEY